MTLIFTGNIYNLDKKKKKFSELEIVKQIFLDTFFNVRQF